MLSNFYNKINVSTKIWVLIILIISILISKSIYLLIALSILLLILILFKNKSVKFYINSIKSRKIMLLFIFIMYIIFFRNILYSLVFIYKIILVIIYIKHFSINVEVEKLINGIMTIFRPIKIINNQDKISYKIVMFFSFFDFYNNAKKEIFLNYNKEEKLKYTFSLKYNIFPRVFLATNKIDLLESSLKLKFYKPKYETKNTESNMTLLIFVLIFIVIIFKEVIL